MKTYAHRVMTPIQTRLSPLALALVVALAAAVLVVVLAASSGSAGRTSGSATPPNHFSHTAQVAEPFGTGR